MNIKKYYSFYFSIIIFSFFWVGQTQDCIANCSICMNTLGVCPSCFPGYRISNGGCVSCPNSCMNCDSYANCTSCAPGYFLNNVTCSNCDIIGCIDCIGPNNCTICDRGYAMFNNTCFQCPENCDNCTLEISLIVTINKSSNITDNNNIISGLSPQTDLNSSINQNLTTDNVSQQSGQNPTPDLEANIIMNITMICINCTSGYFLNQTNNSCPACSENCTNCTDLNTCFNCLNGNFVNQTVDNINSLIIYNCSVCDENCTYCFGPANCSLCYKGFFNVNGQCFDCPKNCPSCNSASSCNCDQGYYTNGIECLSCGDNCEHCGDNTYCLKCMNNAIWMNGQCIKCPQGCNTCTSCTTCKSNLFQDIDGICKSCPVNCFSCKNSTVCAECIKGFFLNETTYQCDSCDNNCAQCISNKICLQCMNGFGLQVLNASNQNISDFENLTQIQDQTSIINTSIYKNITYSTCSSKISLSISINYI